MLLGEGLGRHHQGGLVALLDGSEQRVERNDGLSRSDVALEQALHRHVPREVAVDLGDDLLLVGRQREGQGFAVPRDELSRPAQRRSRHPDLPGAPAREAELEHEQLLEGKPTPRCLGLLGLGVEGGHRVPFQRQRAPAAQHGG